MARILVVDDEVGVRSFIADALEVDGHAVVQAADGVEALARLGEQSFHLIVSDLKMPRMDGLALLRAVRRDQPEVEVVVLTAHGTVDSAVEAMKEGAFDFLQKPVESPAALRLLVNRAVERHRLSAAKEAAGSPASRR
jgi:two-component system response regulator FlrC